jgi:uncharacterized protein
MNPGIAAPPERIALLDTLRGVAVLGIFLVNIVYFGLPYSAYNFPTLWGEAHLANTLVWAFGNLWVEDAMRALFVMLFGASACLLLAEERLQGAGLRSVEMYFRRNLWLMALGVVHAFVLLAPHDVLYVYGLLGLLLFPLHRARPLQLSILGTALLGIGAMQGMDSLPPRANPEAPPIHEVRASAAEVHVFRHGLVEDMQDDVRLYTSGYAEIFDTQKKSAMEAQSIDIYREQGFLLGGLMLVGMALFKWGVLSGMRSRRFYLLLMLGGYGLALLLRMPALLDVLDSDFNPYTLLNQFTFGRLVSQLPLALGHIGLVATLFTSARMRRLMRPLAAVGRMALTHYVGQTVFAILVFFGFGVALFGSIERYQLILLCLGICLAQLLLSPWWLRHFRHGPLEWAWRAATRWEPVPLRRRAAPLGLAPADERADA